MTNRFAVTHIRNRAVDLMNTQVVIYRPSDQLFDQASGAITAGSKDVIYRGPARIWTSSGPQVLSFGESDLSVQQTFCSIPWNASPCPRRDDVVYVIDDNPEDDVLKHRSYRVLEVETGGLMRATRRLSVQRQEESRFFEDTA